eukprot:TRINITY_DN12421_c0_g1_i1.p1 TRINITY_DN12421_c0_g1~~TRINITY_DN12421_c0_g1_i1.p1  ORF type:complete len:424 (+),score=60.32 TRINITY_DN12421_c0_g1_i1:47-1273(+)
MTGAKLQARQSSNVFPKFENVSAFDNVIIYVFFVSVCGIAPAWQVSIAFLLLVLLGYAKSDYSTLFVLAFVNLIPIFPFFLAGIVFATLYGSNYQRLCYGSIAFSALNAFFTDGWSFSWLFLMVVLAGLAYWAPSKILVPKGLSPSAQEYLETYRREQMDYFRAKQTRWSQFVSDASVTLELGSSGKPAVFCELPLSSIKPWIEKVFWRNASIAGHELSYRPPHKPKTRPEVVKVEAIMHSTMREAFDIAHSQGAKKWLTWHGSAPSSICNIAATGFNSKAKRRLDDGWFGQGIYLTSLAEYAVMYCDYAKYANRGYRAGDQVQLLLSVITYNPRQVQHVTKVTMAAHIPSGQTNIVHVNQASGRMKPPNAFMRLLRTYVPGFSFDADEIVLSDDERILPLYRVTVQF